MEPAYKILFIISKGNGQKLGPGSMKFMFVQLNVFIDAFLILKIVKSGFRNSRILWAEKITCSQRRFTL